MKLGMACILAGLGTIAAQAAEPGFFFSADAGANIVQNFDLGGGARLELDPGSRLDVGFGYTFLANEQVSLGAGGDVGFLYNSMKNGVAASGAKTPIRGDLWQTPFLAKLVARFNPDSFVQPFVGVGGGGVYTATETRRIGGTRVFIKGDETDPAVEGIAGLKFRLNDQMAVGLAYKALIVFPDGFDEVINHSIVAAFTMRF